MVAHRKRTPRTPPGPTLESLIGAAVAAIPGAVAGTVPQGIFGGVYAWQVPTVAGPLGVTAYDSWIACRFHDVARAKEYPCLYVPASRYSRLNPFSGKWNFHWSAETPNPDRVADFMAELSPILTPSVPPCPASPPAPFPPAASPPPPTTAAPTGTAPAS